MALLYKWSVKEDPETRARNKEMRLERARISINAMNEAYTTGRLNLLEHIYTKELYRQELATAERLKKFGMHKIIRLENMGALSDNSFVNLYDGKVNSGLVHMYCNYLCEYKVGQQTVFAIHYPKAELNLEMLKSGTDRKVKQVYCTNCGNEMTMWGDYMKCPYCQAQFNVDSASWIVHGWYHRKRWGLKINNPERTQAVLSLAVILSMCLCAPLIMLLAALLTVAGIFAFVGFLIYSIRQILRAMTWERIKSYDENFSQNLLKTRIWNLMQTVGYAYKEDEKAYQDLVTSDMEEQLEKMRKSRKYQNRELLDLYITKMEATKFRVRGEEQLATFECNVELVELENRLISLEKKKLKVTISRPRDSMTPVLLQESQISCGSCGANVDVTDVRCSYCGRILNVNGWRLDRIKGL